MNKIGEIVESTSTEFMAECYELNALPSLGSLVKVTAPTMEIFGIVCQSGTAGIEPGRHPVARGKDEASEEAVYQSSPQLMKLLRSEFQVLVVGHKTRWENISIPAVKTGAHPCVCSCLRPG